MASPYAVSQVTAVAHCNSLVNRQRHAGDGWLVSLIILGLWTLLCTLVLLEKRQGTMMQAYDGATSTWNALQFDSGFGGSIAHCDRFHSAPLA